HGLSAMKHGGRFRDLGIAGAKIARLNVKFPSQQVLGMLGSEPAPFLGDADGNDLVFFLVDCVENGGGREQGDLVLSTAAAKQDPHPELFHDQLVWTVVECPVNHREDSWGRDHRSCFDGAALVLTASIALAARNESAARLKTGYGVQSFCGG